MPFPPDRTGLRRGRLCRALLASSVASALAAGGCESWKSAKNDNPVLGPPPPRLSWNEEPAGGVRVADASGETSGVVRVSLSAPGPISNHAVVAIVNGEPILAGELLAPYQPHFVRFAAQGASERDIDQMKKGAIAKGLDQRIDQTLLVQSLRLMLKADQWKQTEEKLDEEWKKQNRKIMEKAGVNSRAELEQKIASEGGSLSEYEHAFKVDQLSRLYLQFKTGETDPVFGRQDVVDYYNANAAKYEHPARARFQLLMVSFAKNGGKEQARAKLDEALAELGRGEPFPDVAERHSDHATAKKGGQHDWYKPGDFSVKAVDDALFSLPVDRVSEVFESDKPAAFMLVRVTEREPAGRTPLAEVQDEIRDTLMTEARQKTVEGLLAKLHDTAVITKYVD